MSIEEKAKAYDEALEQARKYMAKGYDVLMPEIFPELRESEDERIRKALIDGVSQIRCKGDVTREQMIAYLEKQKEPKFKIGDKLVSTKNSHLTYEIVDVGHVNELGNIEYKVEIFTDGKSDNPSNIKYMECRKVDEWGKLIEQKPTWSEEDERIMNGIQLVLESWDRAHSSIAGLPSLIPSYISWLKSRRPSWKPSKEQMNRLFSIIAALRKDYCDDMADFLAFIYHNLEKLM